MKTRRSKACDISKSVRLTVLARDHGLCVCCEARQGIPNAHYISRAQGGLGIEQNIVSLCPECHYKYDQTTERTEIKQRLKKYLQSKYQNWSEDNLYYKKYDF